MIQNARDKRLKMIQNARKETYNNYYKRNYYKICFCLLLIRIILCSKFKKPPNSNPPYRRNKCKYNCHLLRRTDIFAVDSSLDSSKLSI